MKKSNCTTTHKYGSCIGGENMSCIANSIVRTGIENSVK